MEDEAGRYKAFTTANDQVIHARDIMMTLPDETQAGLEEFLDKWAPEAIGAAPADEAKPTRFVLDLSGSMRGAPIFSLIAAMRTEGDRLDAASVPFEILGFTTSTWRGGQSRQDWQDAGRPQNPGRLSDLMHVVIKGMEEDWSECRDLLGACLNEGVLKERGCPHIVLARFAFEQKSQSPSVNTTEGTRCDTTTFDVSWMRSVI